MSVADHDDDVRGDKKREPAVVLARAVWRDQLKERGVDMSDKEKVLDDWKEKKKQYVGLSRRILRLLAKRGYELKPKDAE